MAVFAGKVAVVTGATSGIGRSTALAFAASGATVIAAGRDENRGKDVVEAARYTAGVCSYCRADIQVEDDVARLMADTIERHGRIDIAVNTVGVNPHGSLRDGTSEEFDHIFSTNTRGVFFFLKHAIRSMQNTGGAILSVGSIAGERLMTDRGLYGASKSAAGMLIRAAALEGAPFGIRANELTPGTIDTPMLRETWQRRRSQAEGMAQTVEATIPLKRLGAPEEVASAILFLCSDEAKYITGARLTIDGGLVLVI